MGAAAVHDARPSFSNLTISTQPAAAELALHVRHQVATAASSPTTPYTAGPHEL